MTYEFAHCHSVSESGVTLMSQEPFGQEFIHRYDASLKTGRSLGGGTLESFFNSWGATQAFMEVTSTNFWRSSSLENLLIFQAIDCAEWLELMSLGQTSSMTATTSDSAHPGPWLFAPSSHDSIPA